MREREERKRERERRERRDRDFVFYVHTRLHQNVIKKCKHEHLISSHFSQTSCLATPGTTRNLTHTAERKRKDRDEREKEKEKSGIKSDRSSDNRGRPEGNPQGAD